MQHGAADAVVPYGGCCVAEPPKNFEASRVCAAALAVAPRSGVVGCRSVPDVFEQWLRANRCSSADAVAAAAADGGATCYRGVGCAASTSLCTYEGLTHFPEFLLPGAKSWGAILAFVLAEACKANGGVARDAADGQFVACACPENRLGPFCSRDPTRLPHRDVPR